MQIFPAIVSCILLTNIAHSQNVNYKIVYRHCLQSDTSKILTDSIGIEAILVGNAHYSNYSFAKLTELSKKQTAAKDSVMKPTTIDQMLAKKQSGQAIVKMGIPSDTIGNMVFWDKKNDSIFVREKMVKEYVVTAEKKSEIKWDIKGDVRVIKKFTCLKATTEFRGRKYTAWFTPDLPIAEGPWKFKGLPGLIMDIYDEDRQVKLFVTDIVFPSNDPITFFVPHGRKIDLAEYVDFLKNELTQQTIALETMLQNQEGIQGTNQQVINPKIKLRHSYYKIEKRL